MSTSSTPHFAPSYKTPQGSGIDEAGNVSSGAIGSGTRIKTGANAKIVLNAGPLVAGTLVVANTAITAQSIVQLAGRGDGGNVGGLNETRAARVVGTSFTVVSTNVGDVQHFDYEITEAIP